jgi:SagB-type dehydrogenase family enzyme
MLNKLFGIFAIALFIGGALRAEKINLPAPSGAEMSVHKAIAERRSRRTFTAKEISQTQLSEILWAADGITDPNGRFRSAPSAGATYPIDTYVLVQRVTGIEPGVYKYIEKDNALELLRKGDFAKQLTDAALGQTMINDASVTIGLFGVYERTTKKYGERGKQYVHFEIGHIGENVYLVAEALGLATCAIGAFYDDKVQDVFGIKSVPLYLLPVGTR